VAHKENEVKSHHPFIIYKKKEEKERKKVYTGILINGAKQLSTAKLRAMLNIFHKKKKKKMRFKLICSDAPSNRKLVIGVGPLTDQPLRLFSPPFCPHFALLSVQIINSRLPNLLASWH
jgi:hypothetical protein